HRLETGCHGAEEVIAVKMASDGAVDREQRGQLVGAERHIPLVLRGQWGRWYRRRGQRGGAVGHRSQRPESLHPATAGCQELEMRARKTRSTAPRQRTRPGTDGAAACAADRRRRARSWSRRGRGPRPRRTGSARAPAPRPASRCAGHHPVSHLGVHPGVPLDLRRKAVYVRAHARRHARAPRRDDVGEPIRLLLMGCAPREGTPVPNMIREWTRGEYTISTDLKRLDLDVIHAFLVRSYWSEGI